MKIAYFDCFSGISGDMILGGLIDAGLKPSDLKQELKKLKISGYTIDTEKVTRGGIVGTRFKVSVSCEDVPRRLEDVLKIIEESSLEEDIKVLGGKIFREIVAAEAKIHHKKPKEVHLHEMGGLDSLIDIIGSLVGIKRLGIRAIYSSKINTGRSLTRCQHGTIPIPSPATLELLKGVPIYSTGIEEELTTPTGAAIIKVLAKGFGNMPEMNLEAIGYGAGSRSLEIPNLLRICIGEAQERYEEDQILLIETNIDDLIPEFFDYISERLYERGAVDVFTTPIYMKKGRIGTLLSVLAPQEATEGILSVVFDETTSFGVRIQHLERKKLKRETISVKTDLGEVKVKIGRSKEEIKSFTPEYESCREIALKTGVSLKEIYDEAKKATQGLLGLKRNRLHKS